jgi:hypothetical protein
MFPLFSINNVYEMFSGLFHGEGLAFLMIITAIFVGGITAMTKLFMRHRERMAMIERGMHPDFKEDPPMAEDSVDQKYEKR